MRLLWCFSAVAVNDNLAAVIAFALQIFDIIADRQNHLIGDKVLVHKIEYQQISHLADNELCLFKIIRYLQNLSRSDAVLLRLQNAGEELCAIDYKLEE